MHFGGIHVAIPARLASDLRPWRRLAKCWLRALKCGVSRPAETQPVQPADVAQEGVTWLGSGRLLTQQRGWPQ